MDGQVDSLGLAYGLSSACGLRPFVVLALTASGMWSGSAHPDPHFAWLGSGVVAAILWLLAILELLADKIPFVDHLFHTLHFATKPIAAMLVAGDTIHFQDATTAQESIAVIVMFASAANALGLHSIAVFLRLASTSVTFGAANPLVSIFEDILLVVSCVVAYKVPFLGVVFALAMTILAIILGRRTLHKIRKMRLGLIRLRILFPGPLIILILKLLFAMFSETGRLQLRSVWN